MPPPLIIDPHELELSDVVADREAIRRINHQRFEMEQLDAICLLDGDQHLIVGYKDVRGDEFWVRGHFPGRPVFPGVLMCEAAAQLLSYYCTAQKVNPDGWIAFGGMDDVRFRSPVKIGDRLLLVGKGKRVRKIQSSFDVQGFVDNTLVFHGTMIGVPMPKEERVSQKSAAV